MPTENRSESPPGFTRRGFLEGPPHSPPQSPLWSGQSNKIADRRSVQRAWRCVQTAILTGSAARAKALSKEPAERSTPISRPPGTLVQDRDAYPRAMMGYWVMKAGEADRSQYSRVRSIGSARLGDFTDHLVAHSACIIRFRGLHHCFYLG